MKANRKFRSDSAVSPVIAVILMVAITVVLAATVYVWVSSFGSQSTTPAKTLSLSSAGTLTTGDKPYTVSAATPGMRWQDITITIDGTSWTFASTAIACASEITNTSWYPCQGTTTKTADSTISAGDTLRVGGVSAGQTLRVLDSQANSVILTLTIG